MLTLMRVSAALAALLLASSAGAATVRTDRPRLLLTAGNGTGTSLATFKARCTSDAKYQARCQAAITAGSGLFPAIADAAGYVVNGDASKCTTAASAALAAASDAPGQPDAHSFISNNARTMLELAVARDWCDAVLSSAEKTALEDRIVSYADFYAAQSDLDVFHDDMPNVWSAIAIAGLALKGTAQDAKAASYLSAADTQWKSVILPAFAYVGDYWHEGFTYVQPSLGSLGWYLLAWTTATDEDVFLWSQTNAKDLVNGYIAFHAYALRPDAHYAYFGDTSSNKQSVELFSRYLVDLFTLGSGSTLGQGLSLEIASLARPGYDYASDNGWMPALLYDATKDAAATPRSTLPTARWLSQGAQDVAILRSGWGADDTFVWMSCGDYLGAHQHLESGSFQIFRSAPLTSTSGCYDAFDSDHWQNYASQHAVHANVISVYQPGEFFPTVQSLGDPSLNVNDGGQRILRRNRQGTAFPNPDLTTYLAHKTAEPFNETGTLETFEATSCHDYVACNVTAAYSSPGYETNGNTAKVDEVSRQLVFVPPGLIVVFDRVEATDAAYDKRFLLQAQTAPTVQGSTVTITSGSGRLVAQSLLPASADVTMVENFSVEGVPHPPASFASCDEPGGTRVEISPKIEALRDYFLIVFSTGAASDSSTPSSTVAEDAATATATIDDGTRTVVLSFAKTGALGGHITVTAKTAGMSCDQDLGANAAPADGGAGAGNAGATGAGGVPTVATNAPSSGDEGGCGCRAASSRNSHFLWFLAALAAASVFSRRLWR